MSAGERVERKPRAKLTKRGVRRERERTSQLFLMTGTRGLMETTKGKRRRRRRRRSKGRRRRRRTEGERARIERILRERKRRLKIGEVSHGEQKRLGVIRRVQIHRRGRRRLAMKRRIRFLPMSVGSRVSVSRSSEAPRVSGIDL